MFVDNGKKSWNIVLIYITYKNKIEILMVVMKLRKNFKDFSTISFSMVLHYLYKLSRVESDQAILLRQKDQIIPAD